MTTSEQQRSATAEALVKEAHANDGLAPVDLDRFWADQKIAAADPFGTDIPQCPIGGCMVTWECVFEELGIQQDWRRHREDPAWAMELTKAYNDKAEKIIGRRPLNENPPGDPSLNYPPIKALHDIFEAENVWNDNSQSYWLMESATNEAELEALLDRVDKRLENLREFILPDNWEAEKQRLAALGRKCGRYGGQRGPITFAASIFGPENLIFLIHDNPDLARRFSDTILRAMLEKARIHDEEAGFTPETARHGWFFNDDNCCLMTPEMYELFGYPILKGMWDRYSPNPGDERYQHSDSAMGHLLPVLGKLKLTGTNFGPTVTVSEIRENLPDAVIHGQLAPFTYSRNDEVGIVEQFLRDFEQAREKRGLRFTTAGSINNGSRLTGARLMMATAQRYCRYDD